MNGPFASRSLLTALLFLLAPLAAVPAEAQLPDPTMADDCIGGSPPTDPACAAFAGCLEPNPTDCGMDDLPVECQNVQDEQDAVACLGALAPILCANAGPAGPGCTALTTAPACDPQDTDAFDAADCIDAVAETSPVKVKLTNGGAGGMGVLGNVCAPATQEFVIPDDVGTGAVPSPVRCVELDAAGTTLAISPVEDSLSVRFTDGSVVEGDPADEPFGDTCSGSPVYSVSVLPPGPPVGASPLGATCVEASLDPDGSGDMDPLTLALGLLSNACVPPTDAVACIAFLANGVAAGTVPSSCDTDAEFEADSDGCALVIVTGASPIEFPASCTDAAPPNDAVACLAAAVNAAVPGTVPASCDSGSEFLADTDGCVLAIAGEVAPIPPSCDGAPPTDSVACLAALANGAAAGTVPAECDTEDEVVLDTDGCILALAGSVSPVPIPAECDALPPTDPVACLAAFANGLNPGTVPPACDTGPELGSPACTAVLASPLNAACMLTPTPAGAFPGCVLLVLQRLAFTQDATNALQNGDLEGAATAANGFLLHHAAALSAAAFDGTQSVDLAVPGSTSTPFGVYAGVTALVDPGVDLPLAALDSLGYSYKAPAASAVVTTLEEVLLIDLDGDGDDDGCLARSSAVVPTGADWGLRAFGRSEPFLDGTCIAPLPEFDNDPAGNGAVPLALVQANPAFADARVTALLVQSLTASVDQPYPSGPSLLVDGLVLSSAGATASTFASATAGSVLACTDEATFAQCPSQVQGAVGMLCASPLGTLLDAVLVCVADPGLVAIPDCGPFDTFGDAVRGTIGPGWGCEGFQRALTHIQTGDWYVEVIVQGTPVYAGPGAAPANGGAPVGTNAPASVSNRIFLTNSQDAVNAAEDAVQTAQDAVEGFNPFDGQTLRVGDNPTTPADDYLVDIDATPAPGTGCGDATLLGVGGTSVCENSIDESPDGTAATQVLIRFPDEVADATGVCELHVKEAGDDGTDLAVYLLQYSDLDDDGVTDLQELSDGRDPLRDEDDPCRAVDPSDADGDGLPDDEEDANGNNLRDAGETDPLDPDTDDDGLTDCQETGFVADSGDPDGDGPAAPGQDVDSARDCGEGLETFHTDPLVADSDGDDVDDGPEVAAGTDPTDADSEPAVTPPSGPDDADGDGIPDDGEDPNGNGAVDPGETDPMQVDTDNDGLTDCQETGYVPRGTAPNDPAASSAPGDPYLTGEDVTTGRECPDPTDPVGGPLKAYHTGPTVADSDGDGVSDGDEAFGLFALRQVCTIDTPDTAVGSAYRTLRGSLAPLANLPILGDLVLSLLRESPANNCLGIPTNPTAADTDGDGLTDGQEVGPAGVAAGNQFTSDPTKADADGDGLDDSEEKSLGTLDDNADSDADGLADGVEDADRDGAFEATESNPADPDTDNDGLCDGNVGAATRTNPGGSPSTCTGGEDRNVDGDLGADAGETGVRDSDSDDDSIKDGTEDTNGNGIIAASESNPLDPDTDNDTLCDGTRVDNDGNGVAPADVCTSREDKDADGTVDADESDPNDADSDDDTVLDPNEKDANSDGQGNWDRRDTDADDDGILDGVEDADKDGTVGASETSPIDPDTDNDGLCDGDVGAATKANPGGSPATCTGGEDRNRDGDLGADPTETNPLDADSDDDSITDGKENPDGNGAVAATESNPRLPDTDGDDICDGSRLDNDGDGIAPADDCVSSEDVNADGTVQATETDPNKADTDNDGRSDKAEDADADHVLDPGETNPLDADTDDDGRNDGQEFAAGTDPRDGDSDDDGLNDGAESTYGTSPFDTDSDDDGLTDGTEDANKNGAQNGDESNARDPDSDDDTLTDCQEVAVATTPGGPVPPRVPEEGNPVADPSPTACPDPDGAGALTGGPKYKTSPIVADSDGDDSLPDPADPGFNDAEEIARGTNPTKADSDGDGIPDPLEDEADFDAVCEQVDDPVADGTADDCVTLAAAGPVAVGGTLVNTLRFPDPTTLLGACDFRTPASWGRPAPLGAYDGTIVRDPATEDVVSNGLVDWVDDDGDWLLWDGDACHDLGDPGDEDETVGEPDAGEDSPFEQHLFNYVLGVVGAQELPTEEELRQLVEETLGSAYANNVFDERDPFDVDEDGVVEEPNGQVDLLEEEFILVDPHGAVPTFPLNQVEDDGPAEGNPITDPLPDGKTGVTVVLRDPLTATVRLILSVYLPVHLDPESEAGPVAPDADPAPLVIAEAFGAETQTVCVAAAAPDGEPSTADLPQAFGPKAGRYDGTCGTPTVVGTVGYHAQFAFEPALTVLDGAASRVEQFAFDGDGNVVVTATLFDHFGRPLDYGYGQPPDLVLDGLPFPPDPEAVGPPQEGWCGVTACPQAILELDPSTFENGNVAVFTIPRETLEVEGVAAWTLHVQSPERPFLPDDSTFPFAYSFYNAVANAAPAPANDVLDAVPTPVRMALDTSPTPAGAPDLYAEFDIEGGVVMTPGGPDAYVLKAADGPFQVLARPWERTDDGWVRITGASRQVFLYIERECGPLGADAGESGQGLPCENADGAKDFAVDGAAMQWSESGGYYVLTVDPAAFPAGFFVEDGFAFAKVFVNTVVGGTALGANYNAHTDQLWDPAAGAATDPTDGLPSTAFFDALDDLAEGRFTPVAFVKDSDGFVARIVLPDDPAGETPVLLLGHEPLHFEADVFVRGSDDAWGPYAGPIALHLQRDCGAAAPVEATDACTTDPDDPAFLASATGTAQPEPGHYHFNVDAADARESLFLPGVPASAVHVWVEAPSPARQSNYAIPTKALLELHEESGNDDLLDAVDLIDARLWHPVPIVDTVLPVDRDGDGNLDVDGVIADNCPDVATGPTQQTDTDGDGVGDACDGDVDGDGLGEAEEATRGTLTADADSDNDGWTDCQETGFVADSDPVQHGTLGSCPDPDGDGTLSGGFLYHTSATDADSDDDGINDRTEFVVAGTDPTDADGDDDLLLDGAEDKDDDGVLDPNESSPFDADTDDDGLLDNLEPDANTDTIGNSDRQDPDSDNDGLCDGARLDNELPADGLDVVDPCLGNEDIDLDGAVDAGETNGRDPDSDNDKLCDGPGTVADAADPTGPGCAGGEDRDADHALDATETDALDADTDDDGILDGAEDPNGDGTILVTESSPRDTDTDDDGILDGFEDSDKDGTVDGPGETDPNDTDTDNDGIADGVEDDDKDGAVEAGESDPNDTDTDNDNVLDGVEDSDKDGTVDADESDPNDTDTDDDGLADGTEDAGQDGVVGAGETDPNDADTDDDGFADGAPDNCDTVANPTQADSDFDAVGDACDDGLEEDGGAAGAFMAGFTVLPVAEGQTPPVLVYDGSAFTVTVDAKKRVGAAAMPGAVLWKPYTASLDLFVQRDCGALQGPISVPLPDDCQEGSEVVFAARAAPSATGRYTFTVPAGALDSAFDLSVGQVPAMGLHFFVGSVDATPQYSDYLLPKEALFTLAGLLSDEGHRSAAYDVIDSTLDHASFTPVLVVDSGAPGELADTTKDMVDGEVCPQDGGETPGCLVDFANDTVCPEAGDELPGCSQDIVNATKDMVDGEVCPQDGGETPDCLVDFVNDTVCPEDGDTAPGCVVDDPLGPAAGPLRGVVNGVVPAPFNQCNSGPVFVCTVPREDGNLGIMVRIGPVLFTL